MVRQREKQPGGGEERDDHTEIEATAEKKF